MRYTRCPGCMKEKAQPICEHCGWEDGANNASHQLPVGAVLNNQYVIGRALGQGGFGITYLGWDRHLEIPVAIKEYYPNGAVMRESSVSTIVNSYGGEIGIRFQRNRERFLREAKALAKFSEEPEIVHIYSFFQENNTAYIVMEYVDGITLKQHVQNKGGKLSAEETLSLLKPVMEALEKVHRAGIVHRDISPDNIMLLPDGSIKLLDFGAVRTVEHAEQDAPLTKSTEAILKQGYAPIEQYQNRGSLGPWTDVYALCATVCYCISGHVPPDAPERMLTELPLDFIRTLPGLTEHQKNVLEKGMELRPEDRISSMQELADQLLHEKEKSVLKTQENIRKTVKTKHNAKKKKWPFLLVALLSLVLFSAIACNYIVSIKLKAEDTLQSDCISTEETTVLTESPNLNNNTDTHNSKGTLMAQPIVVSESTDLNAYETAEILNALAELRIFRSQLSREVIISITFLDTLADMPEDAWDVSENKDGSVMAWTIQEGAYYHLYLASEGGVHSPENCKGLFAGYRRLETINWNGAFFTENATNMEGMFAYNLKLKELDLAHFNTASVKDMSQMFMRCYQLENLNVSSFDTSSVTDMCEMFALGMNYETVEEDGTHYYRTFMSSLTTLDLRNFNTSSVTDMTGMFSNCKGLTNLDISRFDTSSVTKMNRMFEHCEALPKLDLRHFDTSQVVDMADMFISCYNLRSLNLSTWNTENVRNMSYMFHFCEKLTSLDVRSFDTTSVTDMSGMFSCCKSLGYVDVSGFDTSNVTSMRGMFDFCRATPDVRHFNVEKVTDYINFMDDNEKINGKPWKYFFME